MACHKYVFWGDKDIRNGVCCDFYDFLWCELMIKKYDLSPAIADNDVFVDMFDAERVVSMNIGGGEQLMIIWPCFGSGIKSNWYVFISEWD